MNRHAFRVIAATALVTSTAAAAAAQAIPMSTGAQPTSVAVAAGVDLGSAYVFRGFLQDDTNIVTWPYATIEVPLYSGQRLLKHIAIAGGTWNSVNGGNAGADGPSGEAWYESRAYGTVRVELPGSVSVSATYTGYTSPNSMFTTVKETAVALAIDDRPFLGRAALRPYLLMAFEIDAAPGVGQLDGGFRAGRYLELGAAPALSLRRAMIQFPAAVGLSLGDYYELAGNDHAFGFFSLSGVATVPVWRTGSFGQWSIRGGLTLHSLGQAVKVFNDDRQSKVTALAGLRWTR